MTIKHVNTEPPEDEVVKKAKVLGGRFEQREWRRVRVIAAQRDLTVSQLVRQAVLQFIEQKAA